MGKSKKRKRGKEEERRIHPRNKYAENPPDFTKLASLYPSFANFVFYSHHNSRPRIDWTDFNATRQLTRVLLLHDHSLNWWIPDGQLCPTVPNRSNYIHWIEDLLASDIIEKNKVDGDKVRGFDIGTGANCIYPLLGASLLGWSFVGSDVTDVALEWADKNVKSNPHISDLIEIRKVEVDVPTSGLVITELDETEGEGEVDDQRNKVSITELDGTEAEVDNQRNKVSITELDGTAIEVDDQRNKVSITKLDGTEAEVDEQRNKVSIIELDGTVIEVDDQRNKVSITELDGTETEVDDQRNKVSITELDGTEAEVDDQRNKVSADYASPKIKKLDEISVISSVDSYYNVELLNGEETPELIETREIDAQPEPPTTVSELLNVDNCYHGPSILLGVVNQGEKFDFCMCNPPFFESMEEAGLNPKTSCGGTTKEMVCPGGERSFISRIIEDSITLKQSFRWYTTMVGKKSNLKFLTSKLRNVGVTIVKTTEFVQGQTCRWGLAWSFMPPAKRIAASHGCNKGQLSFMLEGLQRQSSAFSVLQAVESFFSHFGVSCKSNAALFTVDVQVLKDHCDAILKSDVKNLNEVSSYAYMTETSSNTSSSDVNLSFRVSVFQQVPGTLLLRGSLEQKDSSLSGAFSSVFQQLEEFLKHKFCKQKVLIGPVYPTHKR